MPFTQPALGVIATSPQIMPLMAPRNVGFFCLESEHVPEQPGEQPGRGRHVGVEHGRGRVGTRVERVTSVEAVPAEPEDSRSDRDHHQVAREGVLSVLPATRSDHPRADEGRDTGREVDDVATGVVDRALLGEEPAAPEQRGVDAVDHRDPQRHDEQPRLELETSDERPEEQERRDGGEDELEVRQRRGREVEGHQRIRSRHRLTLLGARGRERLEVADEPAPERSRRTEVRQRAKGHVVAPEHPHDEREGEARRTSINIVLTIHFFRTSPP